MPLIFLLLGILTPRFLSILIWIFTDWWSLAFQVWIWPVLGFFFMPVTTLVVLAARLNAGEIEGIWIIFVVLAVLWDLGEKGAVSSR